MLLFFLLLSVLQSVVCEWNGLNDLVVGSKSLEMIPGNAQACFMLLGLLHGGLMTFWSSYFPVLMFIDNVIVYWFDLDEKP